MIELKLRRVGNSIGATLPRDVLTRLRVGEGDTLYLQEHDDGSFTLTTHDPDRVAQIAAARRILDRDRDILQSLV